MNNILSYFYSLLYCIISNSLKHCIGKFCEMITCASPYTFGLGVVPHWQATYMLVKYLDFVLMVSIADIVYGGCNLCYYLLPLRPDTKRLI